MIFFLFYYLDFSTTLLLPLLRSFNHFFLSFLFASALLLAYMKGNVTLCKALVRAGACLAATNKSGVSIFNYQLATKQLLVRYFAHIVSIIMPN